jgi:hypothetical protein
VVIAYICLPPNATDKMQPLDVGEIGPLKHEWKDQLHEYADKDPAANLLSKTRVARFFLANNSITRPKLFQLFQSKSKLFQNYSILENLFFFYILKGNDHLFTFPASLWPQFTVSENNELSMTYFTSYKFEVIKILKYEIALIYLQ